MVSAIGANAAYATTLPSQSSAAGADAQIVRYKKALSDCVNCDSASTPDGKAAIAALLEKINAAEKLITQAAESKSSHSSDAAAGGKQPAPTMLGNRLDEVA